MSELIMGLSLSSNLEDHEVDAMQNPTLNYRDETGGRKMRIWVFKNKNSTRDGYWLLRYQVGCLEDMGNLS